MSQLIVKIAQISISALPPPPPEKGKSPTLQVQVSAMNFPHELQLNSDGPLVPGAV